MLQKCCNQSPIRDLVAISTRQSWVLFLTAVCTILPNWARLCVIALQIIALCPTDISFLLAWVLTIVAFTNRSLLHLCNLLNHVGFIPIKQFSLVIFTCCIVRKASLEVLASLSSVRLLSSIANDQ